MTIVSVSLVMRIDMGKNVRQFGGENMNELVHKTYTWQIGFVK
jgi:hypothetical protein